MLNLKYSIRRLYGFSNILNHDERGLFFQNPLFAQILYFLNDIGSIQYGHFFKNIPLHQGTSRLKRHHFCLLKARGVRGRNTMGRRVIILEFMHFARHYTFTADGEDFRNKKLNEGVKVLVAVRI